MTHPSHERVPLVDAIVMPSQGRSAKVCMDEKNVWIFTLPETNSLLAPENGCLEYETVSFWCKWPIFRGLCHVSFHGV